MHALFGERVGDRFAVAVATEVTDGDVHPCRVAPAMLHDRQIRVAGRRWAMTDEVHGVDTLRLTGGIPQSSTGDSTGHGAIDWPLAGVGDVVITSEPGVPIAIWAADCAPIVLFGAAGTTVGVHAGWRGLAAGILDLAIDAFDALGDRPLVAVLGPVIHPCCYEFGETDLRRVAEGAAVEPERVAARTSDGAPALDVPATVGSVLERRGVRLAATGSCTGCGGDWFSHRRRGDSGRHALVAWTRSPRDDEPRW